MLELYHFGMSVCAQKVRVALAEKAVPWTSRIVDLHRGQQFEAEYLRLNPNGVVPTLVHDGTVVVESTIINEYLDDAFPEQPLRPAEPMGRARMRRWSRRIDDDLHAACGTLTFAAMARTRVQKIRDDGQTVDEYVARIPDAGRRVRQRDALLNGVQAEGVLPAYRAYERYLSDADEALNGSAFLVGNSISLADINFVPYVLRIQMLGMGEMLDRLPAVRRWFYALGERASFAALTAYIDKDAADAMLENGGLAWVELKREVGFERVNSSI